MIGLDIIEIDRIATAAANPRFLQRVYTQSELQYAQNCPETLAGMFAAKEAAAKALGTGFNGVTFTDLEVLHTEAGAPYLRFYNRAELLMQGKSAQLSVTHNRTTAAAVVITEEK